MGVQLIILEEIIGSYHRESNQLLNQYITNKKKWDETKQKNELIIDVGSIFIPGHRTAKKYIRKTALHNKWENTDDFRRLEQTYQSLVSRLISTLQNCYSLSRRAIHGSSKGLQKSLQNKIEKIRLETRLTHLELFLRKLSRERLVDKYKWEENRIKQREIPQEILQNYFMRALLGEHPVAPKELIRLLSVPGESLWIEKKQQILLQSDQDWVELSRDMMSAANALTRRAIGLFVGIVDKTSEFISATLPDEAEIRQRILSKIIPSIEFTIIPIHFPNGCIGQVIVINPTEKIHSFKGDWKYFAKRGEVWVREGSRKRRFDEIEALDHAGKKARL